MVTYAPTGKLRHEDFEFKPCLRPGVVKARIICHTHIILALEEQRLVNPCEFKASLAYRVSSRQPGLHRKTLLQTKTSKEESHRESCVTDCFHLYELFFTTLCTHQTLVLSTHMAMAVGVYLWLHALIFHLPNDW